MSPAQRPVAIDLFAGAGGLSLGLEQAGFDVLVATDYDPVHAATHEFNFPKTSVLCADAGNLGVDQLHDAAWSASADLPHRAAWDGEIDLVAGGPPCQGFSTIGKRLVDDERNKLIFHYHRLVTGLRPRYFLMENVPGLTSQGHTELLDTLIREFKESGYHVVSPVQVLQAAHFGVPQSRRRLFLLGAREDELVPDYPRPQYSVPVGVRAPEPVDPRLPPAPTVEEAITDLPNLNDFPTLANTDSVRLSKVRLARLEGAASPYVVRLRTRSADQSDLSYPRQWDPARLTCSLRTAHTRKSVARFRAAPPGTTEPISRFYRLPLHGLCNTLRAGTGSERGAFTSPRPIHPSHPRVISVREAARLHSFPDWFRLHGTKWHGFRQVGNAVPPLLARAVAREIVRALGVSIFKPVESLPLGDPTLLGLQMRQAVAHFGADPNSIPANRARG